MFCIFKIYSYLCIEVKPQTKADGLKADDMKKYIDTINELRAMNVRDIFEKVSNYHYLSSSSVEYSDDAYFIFNIITEIGEGFVVDICKKASCDNRAISVKQAWCVAFAIKKLTDDQAEACAARMEALDAEVENDKKENTETENITEKNMKASDIRAIKENQESGRVFIHLTDGQTICRVMSTKEVRKAQKIRLREGIEAFKNEIARLFNDSYSKPQAVRKVPVDQNEERFWTLHNMRKIGSLPSEEELEYQLLLIKSDI
jgi:hypothetical protein